MFCNASFKDFAIITSLLNLEEDSDRVINKRRSMWVDDILKIHYVDLKAFGK